MNLEHKNTKVIDVLGHSPKYVHCAHLNCAICLSMALKLLSLNLKEKHFPSLNGFDRVSFVCAYQISYLDAI